jgi:hypothetical protein
MLCRCSGKRDNQHARGGALDMNRGITNFFASTTVLFALALAWVIAPKFLQTQAAQQTKPDEDIVFPMKIFLGTKDYVAAKGTLTANWIGYKNNTYSILCTPDQCIVAEVEQIGPKQISSIDGPVVYPIKRWTNDDDVVAEDDALCSRITITLDRKTQTVLWVETPINQTAIACKNADDSVRKATLEASLYWRKPK